MELGDKGEGLAVRFLMEEGYKIIRKNYRTKIGEIDLIASEGDTLVFIEVKTRASLKYGQPFEAITAYKKRKIAKVAMIYLMTLKEIPPCRFDVVSIYYENGKPEFEIIKDAFEM